ncbi:T9SS type A sorting domain-containing protein [Hymenobacter sp. BT18]|uniref:GEVED domain-containing protein n=1 Tax=Hymenobacter sp. BT18 TaxID=2835648 RepID=UPI00143E7AA0|nr:GEVED domain-containing protein [Hymenobacter sp. BT18]QIX61137.1 T9SS type A sorting domain-containing protein [Hymenobacter sp. BT18]
MSKFYAFIALYILSLGAYGQKPTTASTGECGTPDPTPAQRAWLLQEVIPLEQKLAARSPQADAVSYVPLSIHIVRKTDGTGGASEAAIYASIAGTNQLFAGANIQFFVCGSIQYVDNSALYAVNSYAVESELCLLNDEPKAINVYYAGSVSSGGSPVCGYAYLSGNRVLMGCNNAHVLAHELGHSFGLPHPHQNSTSDVLADRELVRRTNCTTKGDQICDTPADPFGREGATKQDCLYTGTITDANNDLFTPLLVNTMSYWSCGDAFTPGQYARIQAVRQLSHAGRNCSLPAPAAPTQLAASLVPYGGGISLRWTDKASDELGYFIERAVGTGAAFTTVGAVTANTTSYTDASPPAATTIRYRVKPINAAGAFSNEVSILPDITYCAANFTVYNCPPDGLPIYLDDVQVLKGSSPILSNLSSGCGTYSSFISQTGQVQPGATYTLKTRLPTLANGSIYPQLVYAWVDYNHNGSFADAGEQLYQGAAQYNQATASFTVPASAHLGWTRLRVRSQSNFYPALADACATGVYGETEEYTLLIGSGITATQPASLPQFTLFPNPASADLPPLLTLPTGSAVAELGIFNLLGQAVVPSRPVRANAPTELPTRGLPAGLYVVRVHTAAGDYQQRLVLY